MLLVHPLHGSGAKASTKRASRKANGAIDCEFASYSAYDPFFALTTLRKILTGIQTSHHTMRVDHHKLCLQLLGLIEPFISLSPKRNTLSQQPNETLDRIAFHISSQRDLLSLALCSRRYWLAYPV
jgi:hypothetical protein